MNTGLRTPGAASPLQKRYLARSNKDLVVFRLRLTCIRVWWAVFTLILNWIPLLQVQSHTHSTGRMLSPTEELRDFMWVKMNIAWSKRTLSPVRLVLENLSIYSLLLFNNAPLQLGQGCDFTYTRNLRASSLFFTSRVIYAQFTCAIRAINTKHRWNTGSLYSFVVLCPSELPSLLLTSLSLACCLSARVRFALLFPHPSWWAWSLPRGKGYD
jgi:hypothetical protein